MTIDTRSFRNALGWFTTGVAVVTAKLDDQAPIGVTINSFSSVSLDPPLVLWCLDKKSDTLGVFNLTRHFTINILREHHREISGRLAGKGNHGLDGIHLIEGASGTPALSDALAHFECEIEARHDAGDHIILVGRVLHFDQAQEGRPLLYHRGGYHGLPA